MGYKIVFILLDGEGKPVALPIDLLWNNDGKWVKWLKPLQWVDVQFNQCGRLLVIKDGTRTGTIIRISNDWGYLDKIVPKETDVFEGASCSPYWLPTVGPLNSPT